VELLRPAGCETCHNSGYKGRTGIYEILEVDRTIEDLIFKGAFRSAIEEAAVTAGTTLLLKQALKKAAHQVTSMEEVFRVVADA
jgi:type IV pilus assembly protein PilB